MAWLAAWAVATTCGGVSTVDCGTAYGVGPAGSGSIVATRPGGHRDPAPLAIPPLAETEFFDDDFDPDETSSHLCSVMRPAIRTAGRADEAGLLHRVRDPSVLVANAANLSRLCRLQL